MAITAIVTHGQPFLVQLLCSELVNMQPLAVLIRREILEPNAAGYAFQVPLLARWVREH